MQLSEIAHQTLLIQLTPTGSATLPAISIFNFKFQFSFFNFLSKVFTYFAKKINLASKFLFFIIDFYFSFFIFRCSIFKFLSLIIFG